MRIVCFLALTTMARVLHADWLRMEDTGYEGDECWVSRENYTLGYCTKVSKCPRALKNIRETRKPRLPRCRFHNFTEIVCCPDAPKVCLNSLYIHSPLGYRGELVKGNEFPYIVALGYKTNNGIEYACGGTLISSRHILTAAHCVRNRQKRVPVVVQMGMTNVSGSEETSEFHNIKDIIWHPDYTISRFYYDIAILRLNSSASRTPQIERIYLPNVKHLEMLINEDPSLTVAGWGKTDLDAPLSNDLIKIERLSLADRKFCANSYAQSVGLQDGLADYMVCVTDRNSSRMADTCPGDSGGPLLIETKTGRILIGVTSFGQGCGGSVPGVYTAIPPFLDWIGMIICEYPEFEKN